jgi:hypothetical protein
MPKILSTEVLVLLAAGIEAGLSLPHLAALTGLSITTVKTYRDAMLADAPELAASHCGCGGVVSHKGLCKWREHMDLAAFRAAALASAKATP